MKPPSLRSPAPIVIVLGMDNKHGRTAGCIYVIAARDMELLSFTCAVESQTPLWLEQLSTSVRHLEPLPRHPRRVHLRRV